MRPHAESPVHAAVFSLSPHATYACRHSGACCTVGWTIPVEAERHALLGVSELPQPAGGACQFYAADARRCSVHRDHGEEAMPASCQHFPRRALIDDRGIFVTLSHFCPTAAALLFEAREPMTVVAAPSAFPAGRAWDGLDARGQWPPLVSPGMMFELDSYTAFERFIVDTLAREPRVDDALSRIAGAVERLHEWNQRRGTFAAWAADAFEHAAPVSLLLPGTPRPMGALVRPEPSFTALYAQVLRHVPAHHEPAPLHPDIERAWRERAAPMWLDFAPAINRYVAAKGFGAWTAYQGRGARTLLAEMAVSERVLRAEAASLCATHERPLDEALMIDAIRAADWLLVHLVERQPFVDWLSEVEER